MRRLMDAVRCWPVFGAVLWMLPLVWPHAGEDDALPMSRALLYLFGVWLVLVIGAFVSWLLLRRSPGEAGADAQEGDPG
ncbi:hypothetical protein AB1M95_10620 [Sulfitobacter sp. LCG007]